MDHKLLNATFKEILITSEDSNVRCRICYKKEEYVRGIKKGNRTFQFYSYPDFKPRSAKTCSICKEKELIKKASKKIRYIKIWLKACKHCNNIHAFKNSIGELCSVKCSTAFHNKKRAVKYNLKCDNCNTSFVNSRVKKHCSRECEKESMRVPIKEIQCVTCDSTFEGHSNAKYCSVPCSPQSKEYRARHEVKFRKCKKCDTSIKVPAQVCKPCKDRASERKQYIRTCPTCEVEFKTSYKLKQYCKSNHVPSSIEAKKLRERATVQAKLPVESWNDIIKFKEDRPEGYHLDHIIPLNHPDVCGLHNTWNFQWLNPLDNSFKSNKFDGTVENEGWKKSED